MLPTSQELTRLRSDLENSLLSDTCSILTGTATSDGMGGYTTAYGTTYSGVKCRLDPLSGQEALAAGMVAPFNGYILTLTNSAVVTTDSKIAHGNYTYNVKSVDPDKSWSACVRVVTERT
jgi:head-tail adaptor